MTSKGAKVVPSLPSAGRSSAYGPPDAEGHQHLCPEVPTFFQVNQVRKSGLIPSSRVSFEDTPISPPSSKRHLTTTAFPSHNTPYALYGRAASRLEGFPYRGSLWEAQLKDQPRGRLSYELGGQKASPPNKLAADASPTNSDEGDGSLDSSDADLDLTVELASPETSYEIPGASSNPPGCSVHSCVDKADFTSVPMAVGGAPSTQTVAASTTKVHPDQPQNAAKCTALQLPSELPYGSRLDSPIGLALSRPRQSDQSSHYSSGSRIQKINDHHVDCKCTPPQGYSYNPTPPLDISLSRPRYPERLSHAPSETNDPPPTPGLTHGDEEEILEPIDVNYTPDTSWDREELRDDQLDIAGKHHPTLQSRRRSRVISDPLRIVVEQQKSDTTQGPQLVPIDISYLTSPAPSSHVNSPEVLAAFSSPHLSSAPTSPSIYSPTLRTPKLDGEFDLEKLRSHNTASGWRALSDFFGSLAQSKPSSQPFSDHGAQIGLSPSALPHGGPLEPTSKNSNRWSNSNVFASLLEPVPRDHDEQYQIQNHERTSSNQDNFGVTNRERSRTSDPRLPTIPMFDDDMNVSSNNQPSIGLLALNTVGPTVNVAEDVSLSPLKSEPFNPDESPSKRFRTASVPVLSITSPHDLHRAAKSNTRRVSWQSHQQVQSSHLASRYTLQQPAGQHLRQISAPNFYRQRLGCNVGGLPTISNPKSERQNRSLESFESPIVSYPLIRPDQAHIRQPRPVSRFSDSESGMVLVEHDQVPSSQDLNHVRHIRLGDQRKSTFRPILMPPGLHPNPISVVAGRRSADGAPLAISESNGLWASLVSLLPSIKVGQPRPRLRRLLTTSSLRRPPAKAWLFMNMLERADPALVTFILGCFFGPWFFVMGGWYLNPIHGELGQARHKPRMPMQLRNMSNGRPRTKDPSGFTWVMANQVAACVAGAMVLGGLVWSIVMICLA